MTGADVRSRLNTLERFDVGGLLRNALDAIERELEAGGQAQAEASLRAWEWAIGPAAATLAERVGHLAGTPRIGRLRGDFARTSAFRAGALHRLSEALAGGSERDIQRWRFAAISYAQAVEHWVDRLETEAAAASVSATVEREAASAPVARSPVLRAALGAYLERARDPAGLPASRGSAAVAGRAVLEAVRAHEASLKNLDGRAAELLRAAPDEARRAARRPAGEARTPAAKLDAIHEAISEANRRAAIEAATERGIRVNLALDELRTTLRHPLAGHEAGETADRQTP